MSQPGMSGVHTPNAGGKKKTFKDYWAIRGQTKSASAEVDKDYYDLRGMTKDFFPMEEDLALSCAPKKAMTFKDYWEIRRQTKGCSTGEMDKENPNHDPETGRFSEGSGGGSGSSSSGGNSGGGSSSGARAFTQPNGRIFVGSQEAYDRHQRRQASDAREAARQRARAATNRLPLKDAVARAMAAQSKALKSLADVFEQEDGVEDRFAKRVAKFNVVKADAEQHLVTGWASVIEEDGKPVVDWQGDVMSEEDLVKAAHGFVSNYRVGKTMHSGAPTSNIVDSVVFTKDLQKALGVDLGKVGWLITTKVSDPDTWEKVKKGELKAFSIGGSGVRSEL